MSYQKMVSVRIRPWVKKFLLVLYISSVITLATIVGILQWNLNTARKEISDKEQIIVSKDIRIRNLEKTIAEISAELKTTKGITDTLMKKVERIEKNRKFITVPSGSIIKVEQGEK